MSAPVAIKLFTLNGDTRRTRLPAHACSYNDLLAVVARAYAPGSSSIRLSWKDEDEDAVSIVSNADWHECISAATDKSVVRIDVSFEAPPAGNDGGVARAPSAVSEYDSATLPDAKALGDLVSEAADTADRSPAAQGCRHGRRQPAAHRIARRLVAAKAKASGGPVHHHGIRCDVSNQCPIIGTRYHLVGKNYDLNEAEFNKLPEDQKAKYEVIQHSRGPRVPYAAATASGGGVSTVSTPAATAGTHSGTPASTPARRQRATVVVGGSDGNEKRVALPAAGLCVDPTPRNLQATGWSDTFEVAVEGDMLTVRRTDQATGWGQNLVLQCSAAALSCNVPTAWPEPSAGRQMLLC